MESIKKKVVTQKFVGSVSVETALKSQANNLGTFCNVTRYSIIIIFFVFNAVAKSLTKPPLFLSHLYLTFKLSRSDPRKLYSLHSKSLG
jgi:hypothetical protein